MITLTWRRLLTEEMNSRGETFDDLESITLSDEDLDREFDNGIGEVEGVPFTAWTARHVYFPAECVGAEWVASVPRHPNGEKTRHVGQGG